jgi:LPS-assembly protein
MSSLIRQLRDSAFFGFLILAVLGAPAAPAASREALHWSGKKQVWDRKSGLIQLAGSAQLVQQGQVLTADEMVIDLQGRTVEARGHCLFLSRDLIMQGESMRFHLDTHNGTIQGGRISTEGFTMVGERISRLGAGRFQATRAEYTTCKDCPQSWSVFGDQVDLTFGEYARIWGVRGEVADVPITWFPYVIFPLKTERQSGLLVPRFGVSGADGLVFVQPFFWAINRSADMTLGVGTYSRRGFRAELEGRYQYSAQSVAHGNFFFQRDETYFPVRRSFVSGATQLLAPEPSRFALNLEQRHQLTEQWDEKLVIHEARDTDYPSQIGDIPGRTDSVLGSSLALTRNTPQSSVVLSAQRYRNRLGPDPMVFDSSVVQTVPSFVMTTNERPWGYGFNGGITFGLSRFTRGDGTFDPDILGGGVSPVLSGGAPRPGIDPIRKATRLTLIPRVYSSVPLVDGVSIVPSAEYRASYYDFANDSGVGALRRGYLLTQLDLSAQWERIYQARYKHFLRPRLNYSFIPSVQESLGHPFVQQMAYAQGQGFSGYNFDNYDIIPRDTARSYNNYFLPLGNALTVGLTSQLIRKNGPGGSYSRLLELTAGQTVNFREYRLPESSRQPFSRFSSALLLGLDQFTSSLSYFYYPYARMDGSSNRNKISAQVAWSWQRGVRQRVFEFERSVTLGYQYDRLDGINRIKNLNGTLRFSLTDSILPYFGLDYHLRTEAQDPSKLQRANAGVTFQSLSQCWKASMNFSRTLERPGTSFDFNLALNLAGEGFGESPISVPR